jgi:tripartite-type tricarboxylate transporter receptor subunit TctC
VVARLIAPLLTTGLGQQVVIDNRGSASGVIAAQTVAKAPPNGNTIPFYGSGLWLLPFMRDDVPFDPLKDFSAITLAGRSPNIIVVHPSLPFKSVRELIALAKRDLESSTMVRVRTAAPRILRRNYLKRWVPKHSECSLQRRATCRHRAYRGEVQVMFPTMSLGMPHVAAGSTRFPPAHRFGRSFRTLSSVRELGPLLQRRKRYSAISRVTEREVPNTGT